MRVDDFFDTSVGSWDDNYITFQRARKATAFIAVPQTGGVILDIGCGAGYMLSDLLEAGANEILGVDVSERQLRSAREAFKDDPRVTLLNTDVLHLDEYGFDAAVLFNGYTLFQDRKQLISKVAALLLPGGRFTVAHSPGRELTNKLHPEASMEIAVDLAPARDEAELWDEIFTVDTICDTYELYMISGVKRKTSPAKNKRDCSK